MADPYVGEIRLFSGNFAPAGWAFCDGQLIPISQNTALFSLLGTNYGGDGRSNFALPNFQARVPIHQGQGPGLSPYEVGQVGGSPIATLLITQLTPHAHQIGATSAAATTGSSSGGPALADASASAYGAPVNMGQMGSQIVGGGQAHENDQPYLGISFIIALQGVFPARN